MKISIRILSGEPKTLEKVGNQMINRTSLALIQSKHI